MYIIQTKVGNYWENCNKIYDSFEEANVHLIFLRHNFIKCKFRLIKVNIEIIE